MIQQIDSSQYFFYCIKAAYIKYIQSYVFVIMMITLLGLGIHPTFAANTICGSKEFTQLLKGVLQCTHITYSTPPALHLMLQKS